MVHNGNESVCLKSVRKMAESKSSLLAKSVQKHAGRAKEKLLQNLGKVDRTADEIFDEHLTNFNRQQTNANRLQKEFNNYIRCIRAVQTASKSLMDAICDVYEAPWSGSDSLHNQVSAIEVLWQEFSHKLGDQVLIPLNTYTAQFPEMKKKIEKRNRKLIDYDSQRHSFQSLQANSNKRRDDVKVTKGREQLEEARRTYEILNTELHDELPALHDSRILFLVTNLQTLFASEQVFHNETSKLFAELEAIVDKLATDSQRGSYTIKKITGNANQSPPHSPSNKLNSVNNSYNNTLTNGSNNANNSPSSPPSSPSSPTTPHDLAHKQRQSSPPPLQSTTTTTTNNTTTTTGNDDVNVNNNDDDVGTAVATPFLTTSTTNATANTTTITTNNTNNNILSTTPTPTPKKQSNSDELLPDDCNSPQIDHEPAYQNADIASANSISNQQQDNNKNIQHENNLNPNNSVLSSSSSSTSSSPTTPTPTPSSPTTTTKTTTVATTAVVPSTNGDDAADDKRTNSSTTTPPPSLNDNQVNKKPKESEYVNGNIESNDGSNNDTGDGGIATVVPTNKQAAEPPQEDLPPGVLYRVKATYKYVKEDVDELSFEVGDTIRVIEYDDPEDQEEGWLMGLKEGTTEKGLFPANFTRPL